MKKDDQILFEQYFNYGGERRINSKKLASLINLILNSKELMNTPVKNSNKLTKGTLINMKFTTLDNICMNVSFNGSYLVSDGVTNEVRTIDGSLVIGNGEVSIKSKITRVKENETFDLYELFYIENGKYYRYSVYPFNSYTEEIGPYDFEKYKDFEKETLSRIKR